MKFIRTKDRGYLNPTKVKNLRVEVSGSAGYGGRHCRKGIQAHYPDFGDWLTAEEYEAKYKALDAENAKLAHIRTR